MTLLNYLRDNWDGVDIYFNTIKYNDYFINIVPFMLNNKVIKYEDNRNYNNKGDLFITDNPLLIEKAKRELFEVIVLGGIEGQEVSKGIRLITEGLKTITNRNGDIDIFEPMKLSFMLSGFENVPIFNIGDFMSVKSPQLKKAFVPTEAPPPPPQLKKAFIPTEAPPPPPQLKKAFVPTEAPPPPPQLKKAFIPTEAPPPPPQLKKAFIPTEAPPPPPQLKKPSMMFVKGGTLQPDEYKPAKMIKVKNNEYFPKRDEEYMFTDVSLYSSADVSHSVKTAELISSYYNIKDKVMTEASACIGGNSWTFADKVKGLNLVEIDKNNFKALKHNMEILVDTDSVKFFNDNYIRIRDNIGGDIIFYDPPWGGVDYKNEPQVGYSYNGKFYSLDDMANKSFYKSPPELIVFRIPMKSNINKTDYKYKTTVVFNDMGDIPIYKVIFLSDIKGNGLPESVNVKRINYKKMEYEVL